MRVSNEVALQERGRIAPREPLLAGERVRGEAGVEVVIGEAVQVASNFHEPEKPTIGVWFAATLADPAVHPVAGDDAVAVDWFDPAAPPPLAFPTDAALLERLARG